MRPLVAVALRESISGLDFLIRSLVKERNIYVRTEISELRIFHFVLSRRLNPKWDDNSSLYTQHLQYGEKSFTAR